MVEGEKGEFEQDKKDHDDKGEKKKFKIFVGDFEQEWEQSQVLAADIMKKAGTEDVANFVLEALDRKGGKAIAEFKPNEMVDLALKDRKFFRITPGGGGFS